MNVKHTETTEKEAEMIESEFDAMAAVAADGMKLANVPEGLRSAAVCGAAVASKPFALEYVPAEVKTADLCVEAVAGSLMPDAVLSLVPQEARTPAFWTACAIRLGRRVQDLLRAMPREALSREFFDAVLPFNGHVLAFMPEGMADRKDCLAAARTPGALAGAPRALLDEEFFDALASALPEALAGVPETLLPEGVCRKSPRAQRAMMGASEAGYRRAMAM